MLAEVLAPNTRRLYWKGYIDVRVETVDIATDFAIDPKLVPQLVAAHRAREGRRAAENVLAVQVPQYHVAVLYVDGKVASAARGRPARLLEVRTATCASSSWTCVCRCSRWRVRRS